MASVVNLNRFRKAKKRAAAEQRAAENRTAFGRTKKERKTAERERLLAGRDLDGKRLDCPLDRLTSAARRAIRVAGRFIEAGDGYRFGPLMRGEMSTHFG